MTKQEQTPDIVAKGAQRYQNWRDEQLGDPEFQAIYKEEAANCELWLQLVEARLKAGLTQQEMAERIGMTQSQVDQIEKVGNDAYTLNTLRKYISALGEGYSLEVWIHTPDEE